MQPDADVQAALTVLRVATPLLPARNKSANQPARRTFDRRAADRGEPDAARAARRVDRWAARPSCSPRRGREGSPRRAARRRVALLQRREQPLAAGLSLYQPSSSAGRRNTPLTARPADDSTGIRDILAKKRWRLHAE